METGTKVTIGVGLGALLIGGVYLATRPTPALAAGSGSGSGTTAGTTKGLTVGQTSDLSTLSSGTWTGWASSDPNIVSVDSSGNATAVGPGQAHVTATSADGTQLVVLVTVGAAPGSGASAITAMPMTTIITDPTLIRIAQTVLANLASATDANGKPIVQSPTGPIYYSQDNAQNGTGDFAAGLATFQNIARATIPSLRTDGQLDYETLAAEFALAYAILPDLQGGYSVSTGMDVGTVAMAQTAAVTLVIRGKLPGVSYSGTNVNGDAGDPAFVAAVRAFQALPEFKNAGWRQDGVLDWPTWGAMLATAAAS